MMRSVIVIINKRIYDFDMIDRQTSDVHHRLMPVYVYVYVSLPHESALQFFSEPSSQFPLVKPFSVKCGFTYLFLHVYLSVVNFKPPTLC